MLSALLSSFNSMKVRLKHGVAQCIVEANKFQFHEGPIKTLGLYAAQTAAA